MWAGKMLRGNTVAQTSSDVMFVGDHHVPYIAFFYKQTQSLEVPITVNLDERPMVANFALHPVMAGSTNFGRILAFSKGSTNGLRVENRLSTNSASLYVPGRNAYFSHGGALLDAGKWFVYTLMGDNQSGTVSLYINGSQSSLGGTAEPTFLDVDRLRLLPGCTYYVNLGMPSLGIPLLESAIPETTEIVARHTVWLNALNEATLPTE